MYNNAHWACILYIRIRIHTYTCTALNTPRNKAFMDKIYSLFVCSFPLPLSSCASASLSASSFPPGPSSETSVPCLWLLAASTPSGAPSWLPSAASVHSSVYRVASRTVHVSPWISPLRCDLFLLSEVVKKEIRNFNHKFVLSIICASIRVYI